MKKLSVRLYEIASNINFDAGALRQAYENEALSESDKQVISRYMHGSELRSDWFSLQDIAIKLNKVEA